MKQSHTGWVATLLVLLLPLLGLAGWEAFQRHRFRSQAERLDAAIRTFQAEAAMPGEDGAFLPTASGRRALPYFAVVTEAMETWDQRYYSWVVGAVFVDRMGGWHPCRFHIEIEQRRTLLLGRPEILFFRHGNPDPSIESLLENVLKDFTYTAGVEVP